MPPVAERLFREGSNLLMRWQAGDAAVMNELRTLFDAVIDGQHDSVFQQPAPTDSVGVTASLHLTTLTLLTELHGLTSSEFYKGDPERYVRTTLMTQRLLGIRKLTLHWPVYAFGAEGLGQATVYADGHAPAAALGKPLVNRTNWRELRTPDLENGVFRITEEMLACFSNLTNLEPVAHLPAPYSLAADIIGQEGLILALIEAPEFVDEFLDHLTEQLFVPWCARLFQQFPSIRIELSDASGSPDFIGPDLFKKTAARPVLRLINNNPWGDRVFVANYRGDTVPNTPGDGESETDIASLDTGALTELIDFKLTVCPEFIIKLEADHAPLSFYVEQAVQRAKPLHLGIGATRIDRNNNADRDTVREELREMAAAYAQAIKAVSNALAKNGYSRADLARPGDILFEDINPESDFDLVRTIVESVALHGSTSSPPD